MKCNEYKTKSGKPIRLWQGDCMELIDGKPENHWDLAIVDPPYGLNITKGLKNKKGGTKGWKRHDEKEWDMNIPTKEYFNLLFKTSKNQVVFGANYFTDFLPPSRGWFVWDKVNYGVKHSHCEFIFTSFDRPSRVYEENFGSERGVNSYLGDIHPTQKSTKIYRWILNKYAENRDSILDTHGGSMSLAIACYIEDFELDIIELDDDYYNDAVQRFEQHISQKTLF